MKPPQPKTIIITGPTAVGKTNTAIEIAEKFGLEIISADSLQVYKKLDIGTSKPSQEELLRIHHHCIDIVEPDEEFNANMFAEIARNLQKQNRDENKHTLVCGGTGLFIEAFLQDYACSIPSDSDVRKRITLEGEELGLSYLFQQLQEKDALYAEKITAKDRQKIVRALEVLEITGKPFSSFHQTAKNAPPPDPTLLYVVLNQERKKLYERINDRVDAMMKNGFYGEVVSLIEEGYDRNLKPLKSIGYNELIAHYYGEIPLHEAVDKIKQNSRRLAKRQLTWHRRHKEAIEIDIDAKMPSEEIERLILQQ